MALKGSPDNDGLCRLETLHAFVTSYASLMQSMHIDLSAGIHFTGEGQMEGLSCQRRVRIWLQIDNVALNAGFENFVDFGVFFSHLLSFNETKIKVTNIRHVSVLCVYFGLILEILQRFLTPNQHHGQQLQGNKGSC